MKSFLRIIVILVMICKNFTVYAQEYTEYDRDIARLLRQVDVVREDDTDGLYETILSRFNTLTRGYSIAFHLDLTPAEVEYVSEKSTQDYCQRKQNIIDADRLLIPYFKERLTSEDTKRLCELTAAPDYMKAMKHARKVHSVDVLEAFSSSIAASKPEYDAMGEDAVIPFTNCSEEYRKKFMEWYYLNDHANQKKHFSKSIGASNEFRGKEVHPLEEEVEFTEKVLIEAMLGKLEDEFTIDDLNIILDFEKTPEGQKLRQALDGIDWDAFADELESVSMDWYCDHLADYVISNPAVLAIVKAIIQADHDNEDTYYLLNEDTKNYSTEQLQRDWQRRIDACEVLSKYESMWERKTSEKQYAKLRLALLIAESSGDSYEKVEDLLASAIKDYAEIAERADDDVKEESRNSILELITGIAHKYGDRKDYAHALSLMEQVISVVPDNPYLYCHKGEFLFLNGKKKQALEMWKIAVQKVGEQEIKESNLERLLRESNKI